MHGQVSSDACGLSISQEASSNSALNGSTNRMHNGNATLRGDEPCNSIAVESARATRHLTSDGCSLKRKGIFDSKESPQAVSSKRVKPIQSHHENLGSLLCVTAQNHPQNGLLFYQPGQLESNPSQIQYPDFVSQVRRAATQLLQLNVKPSSIILLHFNSHYDHLLYFWAATYAGLTPALSTPLSNDLQQRKSHLGHLWSLMKDPICLTRRGFFVEFSTPSILKLQAVEELPPAREGDHLFRDGWYLPVNQGAFKTKEDVAVLMLTSGSTGNAKAVCLTHGLILKSIESKCKAHATGPDTPFFSWIGADHVAGLTEMHAHGLWAGASQVFVHAADVVQDPLAFIKIIRKHQISHAFSPNFFLASLLRALRAPSGLEYRKDMNISSLRTIVTGGEANVVETCLALTEVLQVHGTPRNCLRPAFGMTETNGGCIYSTIFPDHDTSNGYEFASVGKCIDGIEMRITDPDGYEIRPGAGVIGNLEVRGPIVFSSYLNNPDATAESFHDRWFVTGDQGMIDSAGQLSLTGRSKDVLNINGVNHSPSLIETSLENIEGTIPSFTLVFAHRVRGSDTEGLGVVYLPSYAPDDVESRVATNNAITSAVLLQVGVRPLIIPLDESLLQKSTLGKLSRNKIRKALEGGDLDRFRLRHEELMAHHHAIHYESPANKMEQLILDTFMDVIGAHDLQLGVTTNMFAMGINSIDIIKVKSRLQRAIGYDEIPMTSILSYPTARDLATALSRLQEVHEYNPMVVLQNAGSKAPLWLIHPGVGEVLIFLALASYFKDRPIYAMRARGFEENEKYFTNIDEIITTYVKKIMEVQPHGPYAIAGYSFGSMIAFEVTKQLQKSDEVRFLGIFNLPPHIKFRMRQLDWTNCLLHLSYFLGFFSEEYAHRMHPILQKQSREETLKHILNIAPRDRMGELNLDNDKLANWTNLAYSLQSSATDYEPSGMAESMNVFCAVPLAEVARDMEDWMTNHLGKWEHFSRTPPKFHHVDGAHYTMISPAHVHTFQRTLKLALEQRGI